MTNTYELETTKNGLNLCDFIKTGLASQSLLNTNKSIYIKHTQA